MSFYCEQLARAATHAPAGRPGACRARTTPCRIAPARMGPPFAAWREHAAETRRLKKAAARVLAGAADRDVSEIRGELRDFRNATTASFNALRQDFVDLREHVDRKFEQAGAGADTWKDKKAHEAWRKLLVLAQPQAEGS